MKLKSILKTLSVDHLTDIQAHWKITPADLSESDTEEDKKTALINNLYQRLQNRALWEKATSGLSKEEHNLVNFLAIHGGDLERDELARRFCKKDLDHLDKMVHSLAKRGIVLYDELPGLSRKLVLAGIPEPFLRYIDLPSFWEGYLGNFLKELSNNELKHVATQGLRIQPESACKNYLIWLIRDHLLKPKFLRTYIEKLPSGPSQVVDLLLERKGVCVYRDLLELNVQRRYDHSRGDAIHWLLNTSGLLFTAVPGGNKYNNLLMLPRDIVYIITNHYKPDDRTFQELDSVTLVKKENKPSVVSDNSNTVLRDLVVLCNFIDRYPVKVLATSGIGKNDLKKILPQLSRHKTLKYAEFLSLFALQKKFLVSTGDTYRISNTFLNWLDDSQNAYVDLICWWLRTTAWNEEFVEGNTIHIEPKPTGLTSIVAFRRTVIEVLNEMPRDRWCLFSGFLEEVLPIVEQEIPSRNEPLVYDKHTRSNALVIESILAECFHWLGIIQIGLQNEKDAELIGMRQGDGKTLKARGGSRGRPRKQQEISFTFRFTDLGRFVFVHHPEHWEEMFREQNEDLVQPMKFNEEHVIIQQTHEVIVPPDLKLRTFYHLNEVATIKSLDVMSIMDVTRESIRDGLDRGLRGEEILEFLKNVSRMPLPESLEILVKECSDKHGEVNMGFAGGYIVIDEPDLLEQIRLNRRIAPAIKDVVEDRVVILNTDVDVKRLARELQKIGFMPRLSSEHVIMKDDEMFHLSLPREDMYSLIAAVRYAMEARDPKGIAVAEDRLAPVLERLKPDARTFAGLENEANLLLSTWMKAAENARSIELEKMKDQYQSQLSRIVSTTATRGVSKHHFKGPNPAEDEDDIEQMLDFAVENEFEVEIKYVKSDRSEVSETVAPEAVERDRLLGRCRSRDNAFAVYKIDRIIESRLV